MLLLNLYKSDKPEKKYYVEYTNPNTNRLNKMYFGAAEYDTFIDHKDEDRKERYLLRHKKREDWDSLSPGMLSARLLWNLSTLSDSIRDTNKRFNNIKIVNKTKNNVASGNVLNQKPSAYRSMKLAKLGLTKPTTKLNKGKLIDWTNEKWQNLTARLTDGEFYDCGTKGKKQKKQDLPSVCRPSIKVNDKTPKPLAHEIDNKTIKKAIKMKQQGQRINWIDL